MVERFDRREEGDRVVRLHQEDVCQALGVDPQRKYQADGGPSAADVVRLLRRRSSRAAQDVLAFIDRLVLAVAIGNADAHAKNYSLLLADGEDPPGACLRRRLHGGVPEHRRHPGDGDR